jgi:hypothetical protein
LESVESTTPAPPHIGNVFDASSKEEGKGVDDAVTEKWDLKRERVDAVLLLAIRLVGPLLGSPLKTPPLHATSLFDPRHMESWSFQVCSAALSTIWQNRRPNSVYCAAL